MSLLKLSSILETIAIIMLNATAHQNPSTLKPVTMRVVSIIIAALITNRNKPKVKKVMGIVKIIRIGFKMLFNTERTAAIIKAVKKSGTVTPGNRYAVIITANAEMIILISVFILF